MPHDTRQEPDLRPYCGSPLAERKAHLFRLVERTPHSDAYCCFCPAERRFEPDMKDWVGRGMRSFSPAARQARADLERALREAEAM